MTDFIVALSVLFISAGVFSLVANHFGLPIVPFYILAGLSIGWIIEQDALLELALWGIAFLVFVFGIRVDLGDLQSVLKDGELAAFTQLIVVAPIAFVVGYVLGETFGFGDPFRNALYFSAAATLSSTLVGSQVLYEEIRSNLVYGRLASSIHFFDDLTAIGVLLVLSSEVLTDAQLITSKIGYGVLFLVTGLVIYRHGYPLLIRVAGGSDELVLMGSISILIGFLAAAEAVDISIVVGAFAAGIAIRTEGTESLGVRNGIASIKDFFAAIFFVTIGALVAVPTVEAVVFAGALLVLVVVFNPLVHTLAFVYEGYDGRSAFLAGSSLNQVSELSLVIAIQAWLLGTIEEPLFEAIIFTAAVTMIVGAVTSRHENALYRRFFSRVLEGRTNNIDNNSAVEEGVSDHVVVVGFGRQGRRIVSELEELGQSYVVIENDPARLSDLRAGCENYVFGDAMAEYPMTLAELSNARLIVSTVDYRPLSKTLLEHETDSDMILRADSSPEAEMLLDEGALFVMVPSVLASDQLVENVRRVLEAEAEADVLEQEHREYLTHLKRAGLTPE